MHLQLPILRKILYNVALKLNHLLVLPLCCPIMALTGYIFKVQNINSQNI